MTPLSLCLIALGLSTDGAIAMAAQATIAARIHVRDLVRIFLVLGSAHAAMTGVGILFGSIAGAWISAVDHWLVLAVLGTLGVRAIREGLARPTITGSTPGETSALSWTRLLPLALATSLDAAAVGMTLPMMGASIPLALLVLGLVPGAVAVLAAALAKPLRGAVGPRLGIVGGVLLCVIAVQTVVEHVSHGR